MNKDIFIENKEYISAGRASKKLGYAQDYIGELIRRGKVPGRMIGRTWYVELESLLKHRKSRGKNGKKFEPAVELQMHVELPKPVAESAPVLNYIPEPVEELPKLTKYEPKLENFRFLKNFAAIAISVVIVVEVTASWVGFLSPQIADKADIKIADAMSTADVALAPIQNAIHGAETNIKNYFSGLLSGIFPSPSGLLTQAKPGSAGTTAEGVVVTSEAGNHQDIVAKIKGIFSDPVNVSSDADGSSGVITPVFVSATSSTSYTYVLVPVKTQ